MLEEEEESMQKPRRQDQDLNNDEETFKPREGPLAIYNKVIM